MLGTLQGSCIRQNAGTTDPRSGERGYVGGWDVGGEQRMVGVSRRSFLQSGALGACGVPACVESGSPQTRGADAAEPIRLETSRLTVELRRADGALVKLHNRLTDDVKGIREAVVQ